MPAKHRPDDLDTWASQGRSIRYKPQASYKELSVGWWAWWKAMQPRWRDTSDLASSQSSSEGLVDLLVTGQSGFLEIMVVLGWWGIMVEALSSESRTEARADWQAALGDVGFVLQHTT